LGSAGKVVIKEGREAGGRWFDYLIRWGVPRVARRIVMDCAEADASLSNEMTRSTTRRSSRILRSAAIDSTYTEFKAWSHE
jgi:hypothetical protein